NYLEHYLYVGFRWIKPGKWYNNIYLNQNFTYSRRFTPSSYQYFRYNINANSQLKNLWVVGFFVGYNAAANDYYEPRVAGRVFKSPQKMNYEVFVFSNQVKKYSFNADLTAGTVNLFSGKS